MPAVASWRELLCRTRDAWPLLVSHEESPHGIRLWGIRGSRLYLRCIPISPIEFLTRWWCIIITVVIIILITATTTLAAMASMISILVYPITSMMLRNGREASYKRWHGRPRARHPSNDEPWTPVDRAHSLLAITLRTTNHKCNACSNSTTFWYHLHCSCWWWQYSLFRSLARSLILAVTTEGESPPLASDTLFFFKKTGDAMAHKSGPDERAKANMFTSTSQVW